MITLLTQRLYFLFVVIILVVVGVRCFAVKCWLAIAVYFLLLLWVSPLFHNATNYCCYWLMVSIFVEYYLLLLHLLISCYCF